MVELSTGQHFGQNKATLRLRDALLIEAGHTAGMDVPWHYHENAYFYYHIRGRLTEVNRRRSQLCVPGTVLFHYWQEPHFNHQFSEDALFLHLEFNKQWFERHDIVVSALEGDHNLPSWRYSKDFERMYAEARINDNVSQIAIEGLALGAFASMMRCRLESHAIPKWVNKVKELLNEDGPGSLTLAYVARQCDVHPVHLSRNFSKYFQLSFGEYLRKVRMEKARTLLNTFKLWTTVDH
jgi:AraC family transcriptional regulator